MTSWDKMWLRSYNNPDNICQAYNNFSTDLTFSSHKNIVHMKYELLCGSLQCFASNVVFTSLKAISLCQGRSAQYWLCWREQPETFVISKSDLCKQSSLLELLLYSLLLYGGCVGVSQIRLFLPNIYMCSFKKSFDLCLVTRWLCLHGLLLQLKSLRTFSHTFNLLKVKYVQKSFKQSDVWP